LFGMLVLTGLLALIFGLVYDPTKMLGFQEATQEGFTQGRSVIWTNLVGTLASNTPLQWIFGRGLFADLILSVEHLSLTNGTPHNAHDEFLHLLFTQGLFGMGLYAALWIQMYRYAHGSNLPKWASGTGIVASLIFCAQGLTAVTSSYATKTWPLVMVFLAIKSVARKNIQQKASGGQQKCEP